MSGSGSVNIYGDRGKPLSLQAKAWKALIANEVKTQTATNHNQIFLIGRSLFTKEEFDRANDKDHATIHGFQTFYGPFDTIAQAHEFIANYPQDKFPGDDEWKWINPGEVEVLTSVYLDPSETEIVHNASLPFQAQLGYNETQRRIKDIEDTRKTMKEREEVAA